MKVEELKSHIKECAQQSRAATVQRHQLKASGEDRQSTGYQKAMWQLSDERRDHRYRGRLAHLAYGFVRGVPYLSIEAKTSESPYVLGIALLAGVDEDLVLAWLNPVQQEEAA